MSKPSEQAPQFISNYQGQSDYRFKGQRISVRHFALDYGDYQPDVFEHEILPRVGTVWEFLGENYPDEELMAFFPGYVPSRYNRETLQVETTEPAQVEPYHFGSQQGFIATVEVIRRKRLAESVK